jgi:hypothetical protein
MPAAKPYVLAVTVLEPAAASPLFVLLPPTDGTNLDGSTFVRPLNKYQVGGVRVACLN